MADRGRAPGPAVEVLYWQGCPSWQRAVEMVRAEMESVGLDPETLSIREVDTDAAAERERFTGSPTIRVAGLDIQDPGDSPTGLTCRVYRHRDGRISPLPDPADIRDSLRATSP